MWEPGGRLWKNEAALRVAALAVNHNLDQADVPGRSHGTIEMTPDGSVVSSNESQPGQSGFPQRAQTTAAGTSIESRASSLGSDERSADNRAMAHPLTWHVFSLLARKNDACD